MLEIPGEDWRCVSLGVQLDGGTRQKCRSGVPSWPYLVGSELAPATAKRGDKKNVFNAASMLDMSRVRVSNAL